MARFESCPIRGEVQPGLRLRGHVRVWHDSPLRHHALPDGRRQDGTGGGGR